MQGLKRNAEKLHLDFLQLFQIKLVLGPSTRCLCSYKIISKSGFTVLHNGVPPYNTELFTGRVNLKDFLDIL